MSDRPTRSTGFQPVGNPTGSTGFQPVEDHGQDGRVTPGEDHGQDGRATSLEDAGMMGMYLLLAALAMLFAASLVGYWTIRSQHQPWPPPGFPVLPRTLWLSTLLIVSASVAIQRALSAARRGQQGAMRRDLVISFLLGTAFLASQTTAWWQVVAQITQASENAGPYLKLFYVLTGLHAAHVLVGLATLAVVIARAFGGRYTSDRHAGIRYSAVYWHFLDAVWCVLFVVVYLL
jgi:heme/copper-type cytochrome/quinol oxidase subunit 3